MDSIHIQGYKQLKNIKLTHLGRVNYLVGGNASGKSSILECLQLFSAGIDHPLQHRNFQIKGLSKHAVAEGGKLLVELSKKDHLDINMELNYSEINFTNNNIMHGGRAFFAKSHRVNVNSPPGHIGENGRTTLSKQSVKYANSPRLYGFGINTFYLSTKPTQNENDGVTVKPNHVMLDKMNIENSQIVLDFLNMHHTRQTDDTKFVDISKSVRGDDAVLLKLTRVGKDKVGNEVHYPKDTIAYPIMSLSGGMHALLDLYYGVEIELKANPKQDRVVRVVCLEEPEIGLHPDNQKKVVEVLDDISTKEGNDDVIFMVSTHSPFIISEAANFSDKNHKFYLLDKGSLMDPMGVKILESPGYYGDRCLNVVAKMLGAGFGDLNAMPQTAEALTVVYCEGENKDKKDSQLYKRIFRDENIVFVSAKSFQDAVIAFRIGEQTARFVFGKDTSVRALVDRSNGCPECKQNSNSNDHKDHRQTFIITADEKVLYTHKGRLKFDDDDVKAIEATEPNGRLRVLQRKELENYLFDPTVVSLLPESVKQKITYTCDHEDVDHRDGEVKDLLKEQSKAPEILRDLADIIYRHRADKTNEIYNELAGYLGLDNS